VPRPPTHPGLAKAKTAPLLVRRKIELGQIQDANLRELFAHADVMSEGSSRPDPGGLVYYGTTSVLLTRERLGRDLDNAGLCAAARFIAADPHARVRAVRVACLEAQLRASGPLARVMAVLSVRANARGVVIHIDVEASHRDARGGTSPAPRSDRRSGGARR
jgi:hypothetical protein